jgi:hypothetical protein
MDADAGVTDPRVEPITHPQHWFISVHLWQKILLLRVCVHVCGESYGFADVSGFMDSPRWWGEIGKRARLWVHGVDLGIR